MTITPDRLLRRRIVPLLLLLCTGAAPSWAGFADATLGSPSPAPQPYPTLSGCAPAGRAPAASPDPLAAYRWPSLRADDDLQVYTLRPVAVTADPASSFVGLESLTAAKPEVTVRGAGSLRLDFGRESAAWLEIDSPDLSGEVELSISEYNEPAILNEDAENRIKTKAPVRHGSTWRLELNRELYEGVRFGWIHVRSFVRPWRITGVRLVCQTKPVNYNGAFASSVPELDSVWYTGAYAVRLNLLKEYFGAILMERSDRHSWTGDAHPAQAAALAAFGHFDFVRANLDYTSGQNNGIASYSLYWVLSVIDYVWHTGDVATLDRHLPNMSQRLQAAYDHYDKPPYLGFFGWDERLGAGFENPNIREAQRAYAMLTLRAWRDFAGLLQALGRPEAGARYLAYADEKIAALRKNATWPDALGVHAAADAVNAGFATADEKARLLARGFLHPTTRLSYSPFNQYFILQALGRLGCWDEAFDSISDLWGGQLRYGGTTFFEVYRPSWNTALRPLDPPPNNQAGYTSLCHPWGAGVTHWLSTAALGIRPTSPGFATFDVVPHLGTRLKRVSGSMPTPHGVITAEFDSTAGTAKVVVPAGTTARVGLPKAGRTLSGILHNGTAATPGAEDSDHVFFDALLAGTHTFQMDVSGPAPARRAAASVQFPVAEARQDAATSGSWGGVYGRDGYVLCSHHGDAGAASDERRLPGYVRSITYAKAKAQQWSEATDDSRAPALDSRNGFPRSAGALLTQDPLATLQTFTIDIDAAKASRFQLALYFVDWERQGRRVSVELFDRETLELVAPVQVVGDFADGKYLVFPCDRSLRVRINHVRGPNAVLSGLFFDPVPDDKRE